MHSKWTWAVALLGTLWACVPARSQPGVEAVRIYSEPAGYPFVVDGRTYTSEVVLYWPMDTLHNIGPVEPTKTIYNATNEPITNIGFGGCSSGPTFRVVPGLNSIACQFNVTHRLDVVCRPDIACTRPEGNVTVNGAVVAPAATLWVTQGSTVTGQALSNPGFRFLSWSTSLAKLGTLNTVSWVLNGPNTLYANFLAVSPTKVTIATEPLPNFQVLADRVPVAAPATVQWDWEHVHTVGTIELQYDAQNRPWFFDSWSDGGAVNHVFPLPPDQTSTTVTATFVPGAKARFTTSPPGLALSIDGRQNWYVYQFTWPFGKTHSVSAPLTQTDSQGQRYQFVSWSNGMPASFEYTPQQQFGDDTVTAVYERVQAVTVTSTPPGLTFEVDGAACTTPCTVEKPVGATFEVAAPSMQDDGDKSRLAFAGWSDSLAPTRTLTVGSDAATYTATYKVQHRLSLASYPAGGASFATSPAAADWFYDAGSQVQVRFTLALGFRMDSWSGDISGKGVAPPVTMDTPKSAVLNLQAVPAIAQGGVRSAAVNASPDAVVPGSLISIYGAHLAADSAAAPPGALPQTLENITVRVDDTFLPLQFVSPEQVNAQLVSNVAPGVHTLTVRWEGYPETSVPVTVAANVPGLFTIETTDHPTGVFVRSNGEVVTADHPAQPGEIVSVLGTGFGGYRPMPPDGFLFGPADGFTIADPVSVIAGDGVAIDPVYAGRSSAGVGVEAVQFAVPRIEASGPLEVKITVNGQESNTVYLPMSR